VQQQAALLLALFALNASAQELEPRAYAASPTGVNVIVLGYGESRGAILFDPAIGITDTDAVWHSLVAGYARTFSLFGRTASASVAVPYIDGRASGNVMDEFDKVSRKGLADPRFRLGINLVGAPSLAPADFVKQPRRTTLGMALVLVPPLGQYYSDKLINIGSNRWSVKAELGFSRPAGNWSWEVAAGAWFFTDNNDFLGGQHRTQDPVRTVQAHVGYTFRPNLWMAFDATWYGGGRSYISGIARADFQSNTRLGVTMSVPLTQHQSLKANLSSGVVTRIGGDFRQFNIVWQYAWF
jgi:hypothetical protein